MKWMFNLETGEAGPMNDAFRIMCRIQCLWNVSPNVWASYRYSVNAVRMIRTVGDLESRTLQDIARDLAPGRYVERPGGSMVGRASEFDKLEEYAADDEVSVIGIYGMGGVGKTALLDEFHNQSPLRWTHKMIRIDYMVVRNTVEDTQKAILEKLGTVVEQENADARASRITEYLLKKPFVLTLDHVWEAVDLRKVGVPTDTRQTKSKVIVASRIESICIRMNAEPERTKIQVKCLGEKEAWSLFVEKAGNKELIESDSMIRHHAEMLVKKCGGLPPALITIGHCMAGKEAPDLWEHAITELENTPLQIHGMEVVLSGLRLSYDNLTDERLRTCLGYCVMFPEDDDIYSRVIVDFCMGEGVLVDQFNDWVDVYNEGSNLLDVLKSASLLEPGSSSTRIKMHPMTRVSVIWIQSGPTGKKCLIRAGKELKDLPGVHEWRGVERISLMCNNITTLSERPESPSLTTLLLHNNPLVEICDGFFRSMKNLKVLDLSYTSIKVAPAEIGELVQLQHLNFSNTQISSLPPELGNLVRLRCLVLADMPNLISIPEGLITRLSELRVLYMIHGYQDWKADSAGKGTDIEELCLLKRLKALSISVNTVAIMKKIAGSNRLAQCTRALEIGLCPGQKSTLSTATVGNHFKALEWLTLTCCNLQEFLIDDRNEWSPTLPYLTGLVLWDLRKAKITWTSGRLQNLKFLTIGHCREIRQLIHCCNDSREGDNEEAEEDEEEEDKDEDNLKEINVLPNLYELELTNLPELESLSCGSRPLAFPSL